MKLVVFAGKMANHGDFLTRLYSVLCNPELFLEFIRSKCRIAYFIGGEKEQNKCKFKFICKELGNWHLTRMNLVIEN
jgi:hypothetical protein